MKVSEDTSVKCRNLHVSVRKKSRSIKRSTNRRNRRKRSISRYYSHLKSLRLNRKTDDLCSAITVVDITDMEWTPYINERTTEVAEWHKQEQIAYWKSKALSLEYENKMLLQHLRNVYAKQTEDYENYMKNNPAEIEDNQSVEETPKEVIREPVEKKRGEEMLKLYGKEASKIIGIETDIQLNYDSHVEGDKKLCFWPHTALNLKFKE